jgi:calcium-dependent protein kinase
MAFISSVMGTNKDLSELRELFKQLDKNNDGRLSIEEVKDSLKDQLGSFASSNQEIEDMILNLDTDGSGFIDYSEFVTSLIAKTNLISKKNLVTAF